MMENELKFPDSVVALWKRSHGEASLSDESFEATWKEVRRLVLKAAYSPAMGFGMDAEDLASDFVASLMSGSCPDEITTAGTLQKCARKFWAEKWNPCGKEIDDVLRCGLRELVKEGRLERTDPDKTIGSKTCFWLAGKVPERAATPMECEGVFPKIKRAGSKVRGGQSANKRLLTPAEAKRMVCELLDLLGGSRSVFMEEIRACAFNRTRNVISPFAGSYDESGAGGNVDSRDPLLEGDDSAQAEGNGRPRELDALQAMGPKNLAARLDQGMAANDEDDKSPDNPQDAGTEGGIEIYDPYDDERFRRLQLAAISRKATERIWAAVLDMGGDKVFCLYSLPTFCDEKTKVVMKDVGPTSTVGGKHLKLQKLLKAELVFVIKYPDEFRFGPDNALKRITRGLIGRCAEKGHVVPL